MENIEVGQIWVCLETVRINGKGEVAYTMNKLYISEKTNCLTDEMGRKDHGWSKEFLYKFFKRIK